MGSITPFSNSNAAFPPQNRAVPQAQAAAIPTFAQPTAGLLLANDTPFDAVLLRGSQPGAAGSGASPNAGSNQDAFTRFYAYPPNQAGQNPNDNQQQQQSDYATYLHQWHHTLQNAQRVQMLPVDANALMQGIGAAGFHRII